jgi:hypothetical protein
VGDDELEREWQTEHAGSRKTGAIREKRRNAGNDDTVSRSSDSEDEGGSLRWELMADLGDLPAPAL